MKKTIIALMALAGAAVAEDWTATFTSTNSTKTQTWENYSAAFDLNSPLTLNFTSMVLNNGGNSQANRNDNTGNAYSSAIRPNANIGNGATWALTFTVTNTSDSDIIIDSILLDAFAFNASGDDQSQSSHTNKINFTLSGATTASVEGHNFTQNNWNENPTLTFTAPVVLTANDKLSGGSDEAIFTLTISENESAGTFVGLSGATFSGQVVPEPTTATLSLLALAGLAARRRRK